jgi:hypothetical protein
MSIDDLSKSYFIETLDRPVLSSSVYSQVLHLIIEVRISKLTRVL